MPVRQIKLLLLQVYHSLTPRVSMRLPHLHSFLPFPLARVGCWTFRRKYPRPRDLTIRSAKETLGGRCRRGLFHSPAAFLLLLTSSLCLQIIKRVRESLKSIDELSPTLQAAVRGSYDEAIHVTFYFRRRNGCVRSSRLNIYQGEVPGATELTLIEFQRMHSLV